MVHRPWKNIGRQVVGQDLGVDNVDAALYILDISLDKLQRHLEVYVRVVDLGHQERHGPLQCQLRWVLRHSQYLELLPFERRKRFKHHR